MSVIFKIFLGLCLFWLFWYLTGGPLRDDKSRPFIGPDETGALQTFGTSTKR